MTSLRARVVERSVGRVDSGKPEIDAPRNDCSQ
jgi:hypothetical protein